jgi:hypothetical protein
VAVGRGHYVLDHRHVQEQAQALEGPRDPLPGDGVLGLPGDRLPGEADVPGTRLVHARDHVEDCRLARAVRPDQADDLGVAD